MSRQLKISLHNIADTISTTESNKQAWLAYATTSKQSSVMLHRKTIALVAALIAVLLLAGFVYVKSVYFDKIFGDPFSTLSANLGDAELQKLVENLSPGDVLNTEMETDEGTVVIKAICADTLTSVIFGLKGSNTTRASTFPHGQDDFQTNFEQQLDTIKGLKVDKTNSLEEHIASGDFIAALDSTEYTLEYILLRGKIVDTLLYKGNSGETIQVTPISGQLYMEKKAQENALISDIIIDGRVFTVVEHHGESKQIEVFLYLGEEFAVNSIGLYSFDPRNGANATKEQMLDAAKYLTLYNENTNIPIDDDALDYYNEAFFQNINDPVIRDSAEEITAAIRNAQKDEGNPDIYAWDKAGRMISVSFFETEHVDAININYTNIEYSRISELIPVPNQAPFGLPFFPDDKPLSAASIHYFKGIPTSVIWNSIDSASSISMRFLSDRETGKTPLDALAISMTSLRNDLIKTVKREDGTPYLFSSFEAYDGRKVILVNTTQKYGGKTLLYQSHIAENELPDGSVDKWIEAFQ